ncbi:MAG: carbohydrate ABC transporter substrate-binding protein, partial [Lachnospiraceae bacterium]|nr:carbohydrate ABC transporter substrate-binding protein [Lachnospiraceae bacterium]
MNKKNALSMALVASVFLCACTPSNSLKKKEPVVEHKVTIEVNTMYGGDEYGKVFFDAVKEWEKETGYSVSISSNTSDEAYKNRILMDFQTGAEPDVLFYFNGVDSNPLVANKRVISLDEIRSVYPEYAANMKVGMMKPSSYDGKIYAVPVNGYWEALYVNLTVLNKLGIEVPDENTTWEEFLKMCEKIKINGKTPIAASLTEIPHYWFEY